jgi:hypothetical protein
MTLAREQESFADPSEERVSAWYIFWRVIKVGLVPSIVIAILVLAAAPLAFS